MNIYIFPHAGGFKHSYEPFKEYFDTRFNLIPIEYPGRMMKEREPLIDRIEGMADYFIRNYPQVEATEYALWGHSMGSLVAYTIARKLSSERRSLPARLIVSGHKSPHMAGHRKPIHHLPKEDFWSKVSDLNGMPKEIMDDQNFLDFIEPIIRSDFKAVETFEYGRSGGFEIPITVFYGLNEKIEKQDVLGWQNETTINPIRIHCVPGSHFFIFENRKKVAQLVQEDLLVCC